MAISKIKLTPVIRQQNPAGTGAIVVPRWIDVVSLAANASTNYTVPVNVSIIRLTPTVIPTYGNVNGAAAIPTVGVTNGSGSFPVGGQTFLSVNPGDTLALICASTCLVTVEAWT